MILKRFQAENFRNIERCDIEFSPGVNLLWGRNAQGKTNAIEGIYLFSRGRSFRARDEAEMIKFEKDGFYISVEYEEGENKGKLEYSLIGKERQRKKNGYKIKKVTEMMGNFRSVLFSPDDLSLVKGGPDGRRSFLNIALAQCYPYYTKYYSDYKKALEQRNCVLKFMQKGFSFDINELNSWSEAMAEYASYIYLMREEYIGKISKFIEKTIDEISEGKEQIKIRHECDIENNISSREKVKEEYLKRFYQNKDREIAAGVSLYGPQRDDIEIKINEKDARYFASQGQQRSIVLAFKLSEGEVIKEIFGEYPVYLFDDVLSELDEKRREYVLSGKGNKQIIITSCDPSELSGYVDLEIDVLRGEYVYSHR